MVVVMTVMDRRGMDGLTPPLPPLPEAAGAAQHVVGPRLRVRGCFFMIRGALVSCMLQAVCRVSLWIVYLHARVLVCFGVSSMMAGHMIHIILMYSYVQTAVRTRYS